MRHIPEDELHAYLDQGLSRTQCVEIESHLADCPSCRATRAGIAALRDRTTALLARLAPPPAVPGLRGRPQARRPRWRRSGGGAVHVAGLGGEPRRRGGPRLDRQLDAAASDSHRRRPRASRRRPSGHRPRGRLTLGSRCRSPRRRRREPRRSRRARRSRPPASDRDVGSRSDSTRAATRDVALSVLNPTPALELTRLERPAAHGELDLGGMWRTMSWDGAKAEAGERLPHIDGLPVVQVQVQSGEQSSRPVTVVAQQLASGQVIRTIEGPATDVSQLLSRRAISDVDSLFLPGDSAGLGRDANHAMAMQLGDRMLAITGDLPSDSLRAMIRRLNAEMRSK
jgi:hypothetical protein